MLKHRKANLGAIKYTLEHKKAFKKVEKEFLGHNTWRSIVHDIDKVILYNFWEHKRVKEFHRKTARHHVENNIKKRKGDYIEMIIDWECARYSKPDKPLNAYDTLYNLYPDLEEIILPILKEFNIAHTTYKEN